MTIVTTHLSASQPVSQAMHTVIESLPSVRPQHGAAECCLLLPLLLLTLSVMMTM